MYAPPGVDSDSSDEESPWPSPPKSPPRRPSFSLRALFRPSRPVSDETEASVPISPTEQTATSAHSPPESAGSAKKFVRWVKGDLHGTQGPDASYQAKAERELDERPKADLPEPVPSASPREASIEEIDESAEPQQADPQEANMPSDRPNEAAAEEVVALLKQLIEQNVEPLSPSASPAPLLRRKKSKWGKLARLGLGKSQPAETVSLTSAPTPSAATTPLPQPQQPQRPAYRVPARIPVSPGMPSAPTSTSPGGHQGSAQAYYQSFPPTSMSSGSMAFAVTGSTQQWPPPPDPHKPWIWHHPDNQPPRTAPPSGSPPTGHVPPCPTAQVPFPSRPDAYHAPPQSAPPAPVPYQTPWPHPAYPSHPAMPPPSYPHPPILQPWYPYYGHGLSYPAPPYALVPVPMPSQQSGSPYSPYTDPWSLSSEARGMHGSSQRPDEVQGLGLDTGQEQETASTSVRSVPIEGARRGADRPKAIREEPPVDTPPRERPGEGRSRGLGDLGEMPKAEGSGRKVVDPKGQTGPISDGRDEDANAKVDGKTAVPAREKRRPNNIRREPVDKESGNVADHTRGNEMTDDRLESGKKEQTYPKGEVKGRQEGQKAPFQPVEDEEQPEEDVIVFTADEKRPVSQSGSHVGSKAKDAREDQSPSQPSPAKLEAAADKQPREKRSEPRTAGPKDAPLQDERQVLAQMAKQYERQLGRPLEAKELESLRRKAKQTAAVSTSASINDQPAHSPRSVGSSDRVKKVSRTPRLDNHSARSPASGADEASEVIYAQMCKKYEKKLGRPLNGNEKAKIKMQARQAAAASSTTADGKQPDHPVRSRARREGETVERRSAAPETGPAEHASSPSEPPGSPVAEQVESPAPTKKEQERPRERLAGRVAEPAPSVADPQGKIKMQEAYRQLVKQHEAKRGRPPINEEKAHLQAMLKKQMRRPEGERQGAERKGGSKREPDADGSDRAKPPAVLPDTSVVKQIFKTMQSSYEKKLGRPLEEKEILKLQKQAQQAAMQQEKGEAAATKEQISLTRARPSTDWAGCLASLASSLDVLFELHRYLAAQCSPKGEQPVSPLLTDLLPRIVICLFTGGDMASALAPMFDAKHQGLLLTLLSNFTIVKSFITHQSEVVAQASGSGPTWSSDPPMWLSLARATPLGQYVTPTLIEIGSDLVRRCMTGDLDVRGLISMIKIARREIRGVKHKQEEEEQRKLGEDHPSHGVLSMIDKLLGLLHLVKDGRSMSPEPTKVIPAERPKTGPMRPKTGRDPAVRSTTPDIPPPAPRRPSDPKSARPRLDSFSTASVYSQSSVDSAGTIESDEEAAELLAGADSGPSPVMCHAATDDSGQGGSKPSRSQVHEAKKLMKEEDHNQLLGRVRKQDRGDDGVDMPSTRTWGYV